MNWINRTITDYLKTTIDTFPAVLITGPRQIGKSSLLQMVAKDYEYITFDNPIHLEQAKKDPGLFLMNHSSKLILDEIQYIPELFSYLKIKIDEMRFSALQNNKSQECLFLLSGSQAYGLMQNVSESLAGRLAILPLQGISYRERSNISYSKPFIPTEEYLYSRNKESVELTDIWSIMHRGYMPKLVASNDDWETFYSSYVLTYIERDVNQISNIDDKMDFVRFMASVAARSGELLNYESISKDLGISSTTVKRWIQILVTSGIIFLLYPYYNNHLKRMIKTPKVYFMDTGLMAWLTRWVTPDTIKHGAKAGQFAAGGCQAAPAVRAGEQRRRTSESGRPAGGSRRLPAGLPRHRPRPGGPDVHPARGGRPGAAFRDAQGYGGAERAFGSVDGHEQRF